MTTREQPSNTMLRSSAPVAARALDDLEHAISLDPKDEYVEFHRHITLWKLHRDDETAKFSQRVEQIEPGWSKTVGAFLAGAIDEQEFIASAAAAGKPTVK